jgi:hypothetical protein
MPSARPFALAALAAGLLVVTALAADTDADPAKKALQDVGDFVGDWKGNGETKAGLKSTLWKETLSWGWKFKGNDACIAMEAKDGKHLTAAELRYDPEKRAYRLTATDASKKTQVYEGRLNQGKLVLSRKDAATGDVYRLTLFTLADGARMTLQAEVQTKGKGLFATQYKVTATKEGEAFAGGGKKPECVVTGGLGKTQVGYMGKTYYVCCSGCLDEFNANPKKYVDEFERKKK